MILRMIKKTKLKKSYFIVALISIFMLSALVPNPVIGSESPFTPEASAGPYKAALMIGGDETDYGFSYVAIEAIEYLNDTLGWEISITRSVQYTDMYRVASEYGDAGYDVIFMVGGMFIEISYFSGIADIYNETLFVQIPGLNQWVPAPDNVVGLHPSFQTEGHYLAGVLAGQMTETNRLAVVFGEWYEYLAMEFYAFNAGVESVNDEAIVYSRVAGDWGDIALGKQITESLIDTLNVDIVVQVADTTGRGVIAACVEADIIVIGTVGDQYVLAVDNTMTSIGMNTTLLMEIVAQRIENGTAMDVLGGTSWDLNIGNYLYPYHNYDAIIPQSVKDVVDNAIEGIANGSIYVPRKDTLNSPIDTIPDTPTITTTNKTIAVDNINLMWASSTGTDTYRVYNGDIEIGDTNSTTTSLNIEFEGNGTYIITVTSENFRGVSAKSESITITVDPDFIEPSDPPVIPGYSNAILLFTLIATIGIMVYVTKKKSKLF